MDKLNKFEQVDSNMIWRDAALEQIKEFRELAERLQIPFDVVGHHVSKSIQLPVVQFKLPIAQFLLRDNFYDINLCVVTHRPITLSLTELFEDIFKPLDWDWYLSEIARCRNYTWDYFTDEEMDNPQILRVVKPHKYSGEPMAFAVRHDEKDRWLRRITDPSWFSKDWSHTKICWEGEFGPGSKFFLQSHPFAEGIKGPDAMFKPYARGVIMFGLALESMDQAEKLIRRIQRHMMEKEKDGEGQ